MDFDDKEIEEFKNEAIELLNEAEAHLLEMENPVDFNKSYSAVFRAFHSLKGASGMLGLSELRDHMHKIENIFHPFQNASNIRSEMTTFFLDAVDAARDLLNGGKIHFNYDPAGKTQTTKPLTLNEGAGLPIASANARTMGTIYIIDDDEDILEVISMMLKKHGLIVYTFSTPLKAISEAVETPPDIVLTDMNMPGLTGLDVLKRFKEIDSEIPILFISGYLDKSILIEALNLGVFSVIEKPIKETLLVNYITQALRQREVWRLLNKSIDLILFQLKETENYLNSKGKKELVEVMKQDAHQLLAARRSLKSLKIT